MEGEFPAEQIDRILFRIRQLTRGVDQHSRALIHLDGVTVPQLLCLRAVAERTEATPGTVTRAVNLSGSTVTGILQRLEQRGLIERRRDTTDRRVVTLGITERGKGVLAKAPSPLRGGFVKRLAELPGDQLEDILTALDRLVALTDSKGNPDGTPTEKEDTP